MPEGTSAAGRSLLEILWERLDSAYIELIALSGYGPHDADKREAKGICRGLATAIAVIYNPYVVDVDAVRVECAERYESREK